MQIFYHSSMNNWKMPGRELGCWLGIFMLLLLTAPAVAQNTSTLSISGKITEAKTGSPLPFGTVQVKGTSYGAISDVNGDYTLEARLAPGQYTVEVSLLGYKTVSRQFELAPGGSSYDFNPVLQEDILGLDEVVITGTNIGQSKRSLGNAISTVDAEDLTASNPVAIDQALAGKVSGALVMQNTGDPAGGISVRLRGPSTIAGSSDPLYIIDGVIVNNNSNQLIDIGGNTQNRLVDINPNDIEKIEVIKGAAAAAIYGSRASNGVVQIFTKRGASGKPRITVSTGIRVNELRKQIDYNNVNLEFVNPSPDPTTRFTQRYNYQDDIFETSLGTDNYISVSGGDENTKYFASGAYLNNGGIIKNTRFERYSGKVNLDQRLAPWLQASIGLNFARSESNDIPNGGVNAAYGALTGLIFANNDTALAPVFGKYPRVFSVRSNPLEVVETFEFGQVTNRTIANAQLTATPLEKLNISYIMGADFAGQVGTAYIPIGSTGPITDGFARRADASTFLFNNDLNITYEIDLSDKISTTSTIGGTYQYNEFRNIAFQSRGLTPGTKTADAGTVTGQGDFRSQIAYWGAFFQEAIGFSNKLYLTGAIRLDGASTFGEDERNQLFGKAGISYIISEEEFWKNNFGDFWNSMKIRASWGQAGNLTALGAYDRLTNYTSININGISGLVTRSQRGNPNLAPELQNEIELGFDASFLSNRVGLEFTYYKQDVEDLLLNRELSPTTGFSTQFENVGSLENTGIEILLRGSPVRSGDFSWDVVATYSKYDNVITNVAGETIVLPGSFGGSIVREGESIGVFYGTYYARDASGAIIFDDNGLPVQGTDDEDNRKILGDPNPDWFGSLINDFQYKNFSARIQFDAVQGFDVINWNKRLSNFFGFGPRVGQELLGEVPRGTGFRELLIWESFVEDGSFVKLREISLGYTVYPSNYINSIRFSLTGRNLLSFDDYSGWDPETNTTGQSNGVRGFDIATVPIPRTYQVSVTVNF